MKISTDTALEKLAQSGKLFRELFRRGDVSMEIYKPVKKDFQKPHKKDEVYIIISGSGEFIKEETKTSFKPGDFLFVPAGAPHRFINFTDDFSTWVIFFGAPDGKTKKIKTHDPPETSRPAGH